MLELKNISKSYGTQLILNDISFSADDNSLVSILGPSGSGKSTLLQIIGLLTKADSGEIRLNDISYLNLETKNLDVFRNENLGFVFQFHNLLNEFSAFENIMMPLYLRKAYNMENAKYLVNEISTSLGINQLLKKYPANLSGGEQQRVAVARALITEPTLLLADEPTGNLDNKNAEDLYNLFLKIKEERNQQIIMVTHNNKLTEQSDKVIFLDSGKII
ncbi:ABC transporter ATP-binding protein [Aquirufa sp.]|jgi:lipoprotein-releasing system ATP-binding protein|uniref:ABC transporter ATP-binding protein n=1 Tax=Aquirufa sp. TaxID=2676249 RepID=UPI0037C08499